MPSSTLLSNLSMKGGKPSNVQCENQLGSIATVPCQTDPKGGFCMDSATCADMGGVKGLHLPYSPFSSRDERSISSGGRGLGYYRRHARELRLSAAVVFLLILSNRKGGVVHKRFCGAKSEPGKSDRKNHRNIPVTRNYTRLQHVNFKEILL